MTPNAPPILITTQREVLSGLGRTQRSVHLEPIIHLTKQTGVQEEVDVGLPHLLAVLLESLLGATEHGHALLVHLEYPPENMNPSRTDHPQTWNVLLLVLRAPRVQNPFAVGVGVVVGATDRKGQYLAGLLG